MRVTICSNLQRDVHVQNWLLVCLDINGVTNRPDEILDAFVLHLVSSFRKPERLARGKWIVFCSLFQLAGRSILAVLTELHMEKKTVCSGGWKINSWLNLTLSLTVR